MSVGMRILDGLNMTGLLLLIEIAVSTRNCNTLTGLHNLAVIRFSAFEVELGLPLFSMASIPKLDSYNELYLKISMYEDMCG
jgi:hypothetical protein